MIELAVIGDVHGHFDAADVRFFNDSNYDLILVTGDLANFWWHTGHESARHLARLTRPVLFIPGNHDGAWPVQVLAEARGISWLARLSNTGMGARLAALRRALGPIPIAGYSHHELATGAEPLTVIAARPFSPGGPALRYRAHLRRRYGIGDMAASAQRLRELVDGAASNTLLFLAHNGPSGLGSERDSIWGCDYREEGGDCGDPDLRAAVDHALATGRQVLAVVAGHMHHALSPGGRRRWFQKQDGVTYLNAARVPRIFDEAGRTWHHHLRLTIGQGRLEVKEMRVRG